MILGAFLIPLSIQYAISTVLPTTPPPAPAQIELEYWMSLLDLEPDLLLPLPPSRSAQDAELQFEPLHEDTLRLLRSQVAEAMAHQTPDPHSPSWQSGQHFPMRIYRCDAAGVRQEVIASPRLVVIHAVPTPADPASDK